MLGHVVRKKVESLKLNLPPLESGLECLVFIDGHYAAAIRFHDAPRKESASFIEHLEPKHGVGKIILLSGDRESDEWNPDRTEQSAQHVITQLEQLGFIAREKEEAVA